MQEIELENTADLLKPDQGVPDEFPVLEAAPLPSYSEFFRSFLVANVPCLIRKGCIEHWRSRAEWTATGSSNAADLSALRSEVPGDLLVPVSDCGKRHFNAQRCRNMSFREYCDYWEGKRKDGEVLYLKDWHFRRDCPAHANDVYQTPDWFCSDWLNEFWERHGAVGASGGGERDDYRFVYVGPAGSWTPFHCDVFGSFSWSANVAGRKKWIFFPPGDEDHLRDGLNNLPYDVREPTGGERAARARRFEIIQESGDLIFVPSLWHHQVHNLEDTISINHNWFNGANVHLVWRELCRERKKVKKELDDCREGSTPREWHETCERVLRASHGMNVTDFLCLLEHVGTSRLDGRAGCIDGRVLGEEHSRFDLGRARDQVEAVWRELREESEVEGSSELTGRATTILNRLDGRTRDSAT